MKKLIFVIFALSAGCDDREQMLEIENAALRNRVDTLEKDFSSFKESMEPWSELQKIIKINAKGDLVITGANLQIVNGTNTTHESNGKGNLIIGYNERGTNYSAKRTASHCLVIGQSHSYEGVGCIVAGFSNTVASSGGVILGGSKNAVNGRNGVILNGTENQVTGEDGVIVGGNYQSAGSSQILPLPR